MGGAWYGPGTSYKSAQANTKVQCDRQCFHVITACDTTRDAGVVYEELPSESAPQPFAQLKNIVERQSTFTLVPFILLLAVLAIAFRSPLLNLIIHGNLPYKLPVYGEDIQVIFKRTQRTNWYGRVIFGIAVKFAMAEQQLSDTRKYWLGRVIAFDSLRRQRQNELARMHLQLAATAKPESKEKTALRQLWAAIKYILFVLFYLARAIFSFLFGFLFIRVTIAKLVRGTKVESKDLILVLQAKTAIEETAHYLKEYLTTANSFDGTDEVHDA
jgi:hypothetical protein